MAGGLCGVERLMPEGGACGGVGRKGEIMASDYAGEISSIVDIKRTTALHIARLNG